MEEARAVGRAVAKRYSPLPTCLVDAIASESSRSN